MPLVKTKGILDWVSPHLFPQNSEILLRTLDFLSPQLCVLSDVGASDLVSLSADSDLGNYISRHVIKSDWVPPDLSPPNLLNKIG